MSDVFDKVMFGISKGVNSAKENSKLIIEKTRLVANIKSAEDKRAKLLQDLGEIAYSIHNETESGREDIKLICNEINLCNQDIVSFKNELIAIDTKQPMVQKEINPSTSNYETCVCGFVNNLGSKFCAACGNSLKEIGSELDE